MGSKREEGKKYKVISLAVNGASKVYRNGDEVKEIDFPEGHAAKLAKEGHLEELEAPKAKQPAKGSTKADDKK